MSVSVALYAITARGLLQISVHQVALHGIGFMFLSLDVIVPDKRHGEG
jgi:ABC-type anion transport system duplicated permease subunit